MNSRTLLALGAAVLLGCSGESAPDAGVAPSLPDSFFLTIKPEGVQPLVEVKRTARVGDEVTFEARIGGRQKPFVANQAVILVVDAGVPSCRDLPEDSCPTPWDYCCENPAFLIASTATVQFLDAEGKPFGFSVETIQGLHPLQKIFIKGRVAQKDGDTFVVNAIAVWREDS